MDARAQPPVATTCPYCGVGCGVKALVSDMGVEIAGDVDHPANFGRLCSKGSALGETVGLEDRLLYPQMDGKRVSWDAALDRVAARFSQTIAEHGADSVAFYGSGQLLTEDYYVANKLMKGFIGSANIDTNSRLCMASSVAGHKRAFGSDTVPGVYEDLELADLIVLVGSNLAWCHPVLYQRIAAAREARPAMKIVLIDPRRTATAEIADLHLALKPDTDVALFNGLLRHLARSSAIDPDFVNGHTTGAEDAIRGTDGLTIEAVGDVTGLRPADIARFYDWVAVTERTVSVYSQGVNQSASGTDKVNAIINTHLLTGRIGRPGMGPFSVTGQPNAMGGREVGGLSNMLAAHMEIADPDHRRIVKDFWQSPAIAAKPGLKAVDLFDAIHNGRIKALWVMATNPADSLPEAGRVEEALKAVPFLVVSDVVANTDTLRHAHVKLPAAAWGEKDGTVTNSERRISRQRAFLPLPGEARPDWRILCDVAKRMGWGDAFAFSSPAEIFSEHASLSGFANEGSRDFDISGLAGLSAAEYDTLVPTQWPVTAAGPKPRFFADGGFYTPDRKARFVAASHAAPAEKPHRFPLTLNTGRVRDHWHTMTRTARSKRLSAHMGEPYVEIHPADAARHRLKKAGIARLKSPHGEMLARVMITDRQQKGTVFVPMHWTDQTSSQGRVDRLVAPVTDPHSGQPALKSAPVTAVPYRAAWYGFAILATAPGAIDAGYWALARAEGGVALELADDGAAEPRLLAERLIGSGDLIGFEDRATGLARFAAFDGDRLLGALFVGPAPVAVSRQWAMGLLTADYGMPALRLSVLAARPSGSAGDPGATICACFGVGANQIARAARAGEQSVAAIGTALQAGTNCGSCRSEIAALIAKNPPDSVEEKNETENRVPQAV